MATSVRLQKRKRADSTLDSITVLTIAEEAAIQASINERHGKPFFGLSESLLLVVMRRLFWRSLHSHSESKDLQNRLVSFLFYFLIFIL